MNDETQRQQQPIAVAHNDTPLSKSDDDLWLECMYPYALSFARSLCRYEPQNEIDADELAQMALIKMWQMRQKSGIENELAYLRRIAYNCLIDLRRRNSKLSSFSLSRGLLSHDLDDWPSLDIIDTHVDVNPEQAVETRENNERTRELIQNLPDIYRTTLVLHYFFDLTPADIAKYCELPLETVRTRLKRGTAKLQEALRTSAEW